MVRYVLLKYDTHSITFIKKITQFNSYFFLVNSIQFLYLLELLQSRDLISTTKASLLYKKKLHYHFFY
jgi:hypothetical protein